MTTTDKAELLLSVMRKNVMAISILDTENEITISRDHYIEIGQLIKALHNELKKK